MCLAFSEPFLDLGRNFRDSGPLLFGPNLGFYLLANKARVLCYNLELAPVASCLEPFAAETTGKYKEYTENGSQRGKQAPFPPGVLSGHLRVHTPV